MRDDTHDDRVSISLLKYVYTKSALAGQGVTQIRGPIFGEMKRRVGIIAYQRHGDHFSLKRREFAQADRRRWVKNTVDLDLWFLAARKIKIADIL